MAAVTSGWEAGRAVQTVALDADGKRWFGSGYVVASDLVLTAEHVLHGGGAVAVRFVDAPGRVREVACEAVFADGRADVAVLRLVGAEPSVAAVRFGYAAGPVGCDAVGFPRFKLNDDHRAAGPEVAGLEPAGAGQSEQRRRRYRDSHHAAGICHPDSNRYAGTLEWTVAAPEHDPDPGCSPWEGMSGAAVFADGLLIAVVNEHHRREGLGRLTASRVGRWYDLLDPERLAELAALIGLPGRREDLNAALSTAGPGTHEGGPTAETDPASGHLRRSLFLAGSGIGSKLIMAPLFGSPFDPARLLGEFVESLLAIGLRDDEVEPLRSVAHGFSRATSRSQAQAFLAPYQAAMANVETIVRQRCVQSRLTWFTFGKLLFQVAYQGTYAGTTPGGDVDLSDHRDALFHLSESLEVPNSLRDEIQKFARMPNDPEMSGRLIEEARRLSRIVSTLLNP
ncbi:serine protease [Catenulispora yoronensis]